MRFDIITLFPEMFEAVTKYGITSRAMDKKLYEVCCWNPRDYTTDVHKTVDDRPYGGGPGMVMLIEPLEKAIIEAKVANAGKVIHLSPVGKPLTHEIALSLSKEQGLILLASRYEGVDQRLIDFDAQLSKCRLVEHSPGNRYCTIEFLALNLE